MKKILVVDDQPDNVFILQDRLENVGFEIHTAYDGKSGIKKALEVLPDLVLLDIMMPGMSGFEVCKFLSEEESTKDIPVILLTALTSTEDISEGFEVGAFDYIKKPFNKNELIARINSALKFRESKQILIEIEKIKTFAATVLTANHEIKQPLTLINLSLSAIKRELTKEEVVKEAIEKRIKYIESAALEIINVLDKLSAIKKPTFTEYLNNLSMIDLGKMKVNENESKDQRKLE
ncbi:MAG: response regulator [Melioribacteraceae bacterium]|nr:response regulator [Melioribacteraceae bacterium]MDD3558490.1 response regulator [Melioribacteraceae bacterium]